MKIVATASKPPVVIPLVVVAVDIHITLVIPTVEGRPHCMGHHPYHCSSNTLGAVFYSTSQMSWSLIPSIFIF